MFRPLFGCKWFDPSICIRRVLPGEREIGRKLITWNKTRLRTKHRSRKGHKLQNTERRERISRKLENEKRRMPRFERRYGVLLVLNVIYDRLICYKQRMTTLKRAVISPSICFRGECSFKLVLVQRAQRGKGPKATVNAMLVFPALWAISSRSHIR